MFSEKISIIVPVYNSEKHLNQCIESISAQTYKNIEIILINDGSTDGSIEICRKWEKTDSRIVIIDKKNEGVSAARNDGLKMATGELIGFVDSDDYIEPEMYERMKNDMDNYCVDVVMCNSTSVFDDGKKRKGYDGYDSFRINHKELTKRFINFEKIFCSSVWSKLYKKKKIDKVRFSGNIALGEDYYYNGLVYKNINSFYYDNDSLYNYRIREDSISRNRIDGHFFDKYKVAKAITDEYKDIDFLSENDINHFTFGIAYEILYELYAGNSSKKLKQQWKNAFIEEYNKYSDTSFKNKIRMFCMRHITGLYVRITKK